MRRDICLLMLLTGAFSMTSIRLPTPRRPRAPSAGPSNSRTTVSRE